MIQVHLGVVCQSSSFARSPQLRTVQSLRGCCGLNERQNRLIQSGNALLDASLELCMVAYAQGYHHTMENPLGSWLWLQEGVQKFLSMDGRQWCQCGVLLVVRVPVGQADDAHVQQPTAVGLQSTKCSSEWGYQFRGSFGG